MDNYEQKDEQTVGWVDGWIMDRRIYGQRDAWKDRWMIQGPNGERTPEAV